jgi:hypothetical protein
MNNVSLLAVHRRFWSFAMRFVARPAWTTSTFGLVTQNQEHGINSHVDTVGTPGPKRRSTTTRTAMIQ